MEFFLLPFFIGLRLWLMPASSLAKCYAFTLMPILHADLVPPKMAKYGTEYKLAMFSQITYCSNQRNAHTWF